MSSAPQKVQVFALGRPRPGAEKAQRRYYVKWRVDGRDRTRSFKTRVEADRFRSGLLTAVQDGQSFDAASGEPSSWLEHSGAPTWWGWSQDWLALKWPQWSGHSRRSAVESLTLLTPLLVRDGAPKPPADLADWLRQTGYRPGKTPDGAPAIWLDRWSIALHEIEPRLIETVLAAVCSRSDGFATAPAVARRRRGTLGGSSSSPAVGSGRRRRHPCNNTYAAVQLCDLTARSHVPASPPSRTPQPRPRAVISRLAADHGTHDA